MLIEYTLIDTLSESHKDQLLKLYNNEWWSKNRTKKDIDTILQGSSIIIGITHKDTGVLIGFARVLTDHFKYVYIYDVIVDQDYRKAGLGHLIMDSIVKHPKLKNLKNIELTCLEEMTPFYEKYGFSKDYGTSIPMRKSNPKSKVS